MAYSFVQGKFRPADPTKYRGDVENIVYRSSWELIFLRWADSTPEVLAYNSEETIIPYVSPVDGLKHRYFLDFEVFVKTPSGVKRWLVEVKPKDQVKKPIRGKTEKEQAFAERARTWLTNQAKWEAAKIFAEARGGTFIVLTEDHLLPSQNSLKRYKNPKQVVRKKT